MGNDMRKLLAILAISEIPTSLQYFTCRITPEIARILREYRGFNRKLKAGNLKAIKESMKKVDWKLNGEPIVFDEYGNIVNGNHRIEVAAECGLTFDTTVIVGVKEKDAEIYDMQAKRSVSDTLQFAYKSNDRIYGTNATALYNICFAIKDSVKKGEEIKSFRPEQRALSEYMVFIEEYYDAIIFTLDKMLSVKSKMGLSRAAIWAAVLTAYVSGYDKHKLEKWAEIIRTGLTNESKDFPVSRFRDYILTLKGKGGASETMSDLYSRAQYSLAQYEIGNEKAKNKKCSVAFYSFEK